VSFESVVQQLMQGVQYNDPRMYELLDFLTKDLYTVYNQLFPPGTVSALSPTAANEVTPAVTGFTATLFPNNLRLTWDPPTQIETFEIRWQLGSSTDWNTAQEVTTTTTSSLDVNPLTIPLVVGSYTFLIRATAQSGIQSATSNIGVTIPVMSAPLIVPSTIDNFVLLSWADPASVFQIDHYNVYRNGSLYGVAHGTFTTIFEGASGTYSYGLEAVDFVGNTSSRGTVSVVLTLPSTFQLTDRRTSTFSGTKTNCILQDVSNLLACTINETWTQHFVNNSWITIADQIAAGFPIYEEPSTTSGSYEEVVDYGVSLNNRTVAIQFTETPIAGTVTVTPKIAYSTDNITYSSFTTGSQLTIAAAFRYVKYHLDFTGSNNKSLALFSNLTFSVSVSRSMDSGTVHALSTDAGGTQVNFAVAFKSVDSITLAVNTTTDLIAIYDFAGGANPTGFKVLVFDNTGTRQTADVGWHARGIV